MYKNIFTGFIILMAFCAALFFASIIQKAFKPLTDKLNIQTIQERRQTNEFNKLH